MDSCAVGLSEIPVQDPHGPAVAADVVHHDRQDVVRGRLDEHRPDGLLGQIEGGVHELIDPGPHLRRREPLIRESVL